MFIVEEYIRIIEDLICEFHQSGEKERYEQAKALEILLSLLGEIDDKEARDALHMLLHCALTNKDFETQKQQFQIVNAYIKQLEEENKRLNNHNIIGRIDAIKIEDLEPVLKPYYVPKSKVKEKIEELKNKIKLNKQELDKNPDPVNSKFYSFDDYFKWKNKILKENEIMEHTLKVLQDF